MNSFLPDLRFAVRTLARRPAFTAVAVATLALGIGATTALWSVVDALLVQALAYPGSENLTVVWERNFPRDRRTNVVAGANYHAWRHENAVFEDLGAFVTRGVTLAGEAPERVRAALVTDAFFPLLRTGTAQGRLFASGEFEDGRDTVVVVSHAFFERRLGGDPAALGQALSLDGLEHTVIGVLPPDFRPPEISGLQESELFLPAVVPDRYTGRGLVVLGRLEDGVSLAAARAEMTEIARRLAEAHDYNQGWGVNVVALHEQIVGEVRPALLVLLGAVAFVLLVAAVNVANLLLVRATARGREMAVRTAMGAGRRRLALQLLSESLLLALGGGLGGLLFAAWGVDVLVALFADGLPRAAEISLDGRALAFAAAVSLGAALLAGLAPAVRAARGNLASALRDGARGSTGGGRRLRQLLVVAEVALALVLVLGAGLVARSFERLTSVDPGFDPDGLISLKLSVAGSDDAGVVAFWDRLVERLGAVAGVESASAALTQPFDGFGIGTSFVVEELGDPGKRDRPVADIRPVTPGYFPTLRIPLLEGRDFDRRDASEAPAAAIVSETLARAFWPGKSALGRRLSVSLGEMLPVEIVGVVGDIKHMGLDTTPRGMIYLPHAQFPVNGMTLVLRTAAEPDAVVGAVRGAVAEIDPAAAVYRVATMDELVARSVARERLNTALLGFFAVVTLALAGLGLYGVLAHAVRQRTSEIGIRMALGARGGDVLSLVLRQALALSAAGLAIGLGGALVLGRVVESLLFEVSATDLVTYASAALVLLAVTLLAGFLPALRAARVHPVVALRHE